MPYSIDFKQVTLEELKTTLTKENLVPSRILLIGQIDKKFQVLNSLGFDSVAKLLMALKSKKTFSLLVEQSGIDENYLTILSREIRSRIPKPEKLSDFTGFDEKMIARLVEAGYKNTCLLWEAGLTSAERKILAKATNTLPEVITKLVCHADLCRVRWVNTTFSQMLWMAGVTCARNLAERDHVDLHRIIVELNKKHQWYKGQIGLNDFRLVKLAAGQLSFDLKL
jgi:hypothetical protein